MSSDLNEAAHQLPQLPARGCEDADTHSPPPVSGTAHHTRSSSNGGGLQATRDNTSSASPQNHCRKEQVNSGVGGGSGAGTGGVATSAAPVLNTYVLTPQLRDAFAPVGATDSAYSFREVLVLLKKYLFSNTHLFDRNDRTYVNCESDPLGKALGVKRFHFDDVRTLISQNIIRVSCGGGHAANQHPSVPDNLSSTSVCVRSNDSTCKSSVPPGAAPCIPGNRSFPSQRAGNGSQSLTLNPTPGPSRISDKEALQGQGNIAQPLIACPDIPDSCSDSETVYSVQGHETEYCRDTEFSEEEDMYEVNSETFEEYEVPSDDAKDDKEDFSDSDSTIDDVEMAVLAYSLVQDELEDGFWADEDSDTETEPSDEDNDPECVSDRWDCLTCGLKNKPFVRYCGKCWQLRKNWLPDRPKKRRRKPRPKKRNLKKEIAASEEGSTSQTVRSWEDHKLAHLSESSCYESSQDVGITRTSSESATSTTSHSTQDSGISSSSQDLVESPDFPKEFFTVSSSERTSTEASASKESSQKEKQSAEDLMPLKIGNRKRKSSSSDVSVSKRVKRMSERDLVPFGDSDTIAREMFDFFGTSAGKAWLASSEGAKFAKCLQVSPAYQASLTQIIAEQTSASTPGSAFGVSALCSICCLRPKNASIIHGRIAHQATCYQCARRLYNENAKCPVCRRKIHMVCKLMIA